MDIAKYTDYFHDGYVNSISHIQNNLFFFLESSVVEDINQIEDKELLSSCNTFKGILKIFNIKKFYLGGKLYKGLFRMKYDDGDILDFEVNGNRVFFLIEWKNFPPKARETDINKIEIEADRIKWVPEK